MVYLSILIDCGNQKTSESWFSVWEVRSISNRFLLSEEMGAREQSALMTWKIMIN